MYLTQTAAKNHKKRDDQIFYTPKWKKTPVVFIKQEVECHQALGPGTVGNSVGSMTYS